MKTSWSTLVTMLLVWMVGCETQDPTATQEPTESLSSSHGEGSLPSGGLVPSQTPSYGTLEDATAAGTPGSLRLSVDVAGSIPRFPDSFISGVPVFGYAWADLDTGEGIVSVIHPLIGRDSNQNPDAWHTHPVQLSGGSAFDFCVESIGTSQGGISIRGDIMNLNMATRQAGVSADDLDVAAAFTVHGDAGCLTTGLGVAIHSALGL